MKDYKFIYLFQTNQEDKSDKMLAFLDGTSVEFLTPDDHVISLDSHEKKTGDIWTSEYTLTFRVNMPDIQLGHAKIRSFNLSAIQEPDMWCRKLWEDTAPDAGTTMPSGNMKLLNVIAF